jgi:hypothetical protein
MARSYISDFTYHTPSHEITSRFTGNTRYASAV